MASNVEEAPQKQEDEPQEQQQEEDEDDDEFFEEDDMGYDALEAALFGEGGVAGPGPQQQQQHGASLSNMMKPMAQNMSHSAMNGAARAEKSAAKKGPNHTGRDDRATSEQVLDPRTRLVLFKLLSRAFVVDQHGCFNSI
jgi:hypothetical protein